MHTQYTACTSPWDETRILSECYIVLLARLKEKQFCLQHNQQPRLFPDQTIKGEQGARFKHQQIRQECHS